MRGVWGFLIALALLSATMLVPAAVAGAAEAPLAEWHFDQASAGVTPDGSGHGNDLTLEGTAILPGEGRWGGALTADGDSEKARRVTATQLEPGTVTVLAWVKKKPGEAPDTFRYVLGKGASACSASSYALYTGAGKGLQFYFFDGTSTHASPAASAASIWDGQWHAVAGTYDGSAVRLYVDGAQVGSGTPASGSIAYGLANRDVTVGDYPQVGCGSHGIRANIDETRVYGSALSATDIAFLQNPGAASPPELPVAGGGGGSGGGAAKGSVAAAVLTQAASKIKVQNSNLGGAGGVWLSAKQSAPSPGAHIVKYLWDFNGDGKDEVSCPAEAPAVFHQFVKPGVFTAIVTAEDSSGATGQATVAVKSALLRHLAGASKSKSAKSARRAVEASACITQLEGQQPSSKDCIRSFQWGVIDVNARTSNCFTLDPEAPKLTRAGASSSAGSYAQPFHRFFDASVKGSVSLDGIPIPLPNSFESTYSSKDGSIGLGRREIGFDLGGRHVKIASLNLQRQIETVYYSDGRQRFSLGAVDLSGLGQIGGLGTGGKASLEFVSPGQTQLNLDLKLPSVFTMPDAGPAVAKVRAFAENTRPFHVDNLHIHVPYLYMGPVLGKDLDLDYQESGEVWTGGAAFLLPGMEPPFELDASPKPGTDYGVQFAAGDLRHAGAEVDFGALSPEIFPGVFLSNVRFTFGTDPVRFFGGATLNTAKIVYVDGDVLAVFPEGSESYVVPAGLQGFQRLAGRRIDSLSLAGGGDVFFKVAGLDLPLGNAFLLYTFPGRFEFSGAVDVPLAVFHATGEASGFFDAVSRRFNAEGNGHFCVTGIDACLGAALLVSSDGIAGCGEIGAEPFSVSAGAGYHWGGSFHVYFWGCDVGPYRVYANSSGASASAAGSSFKLSPGLPFEAIELKGVGGAPDVTLHGPKGETLSTKGLVEGQEGTLAFMRVAASQTAYIGLNHPSAGTWTVTANPGSAPIESLSAATGLEPPSVHASVDGHGPTRVIHYRVKPQPGQKIVFAELGEDTYDQIGVAKGARGSLRFKPKQGSAGKRKLFALVQENGLTTARLKVASFKSPGWRHPRRPQQVKVSRSGTTVRVSWQRQPGVRRYTVTVRTADGVPRLVLVKKATAKLHGVPATMGGTVTVNGLDIDGGQGPIRKVPLKLARQS